MEVFEVTGKHVVTEIIKAESKEEAMSKFKAIRPEYSITMIDGDGFVGRSMVSGKAIFDSDDYSECDDGIWLKTEKPNP